MLDVLIWHASSDNQQTRLHLLAQNHSTFPHLPISVFFQEVSNHTRHTDLYKLAMNVRNVKRVRSMKIITRWLSIQSLVLVGTSGSPVTCCPNNPNANISVLKTEEKRKFMRRNSLQIL
jgi:hypothetical protein